MEAMKIGKPEKAGPIIDEIVFNSCKEEEGGRNNGMYE
jgi:hypothetical protein